jgi:hypothetical protein
MPARRDGVSRLDDEVRNWRRGSLLCGIVAAVMVGVYGWVSGQPRDSFAKLVLVAAAIQVAVILLQRWVPAHHLPRALYIFELLVDGVTVLFLALGVYGSILSLPDL